MIIMLIILSAILVFLRTRRQTPPPRRHIPQPKSHIPTYTYLQHLDRNEHPCRKGPPEHYTQPAKLLEKYLQREGFNSWNFARREKPL